MLSQGHMIQKGMLPTAHSRISSAHPVNDDSTARKWSHNSDDTWTWMLALIQVTIKVWKAGKTAWFQQIFITYAHRGRRSQSSASDYVQGYRACRGPSVKGHSLEKTPLPLDRTQILCSKYPWIHVMLPLTKGHLFNTDSVGGALISGRLLQKGCPYWWETTVLNW